MQQQGAEYIGTLVANGTLTEGSPEHAALHAIVACAGAAASSQSCGAGAMGAATSSLLTNLFADSPNETAQEREAKSNLISSLVAGIATAGGIDATAATAGAQAATDNNYLTQKQQQARALANANCGKSSDPSACQKKVQQDFAKLWDANEAAVKECATADACKAAIGDLRAQQQAYAARENELQGKLANGTITGAEISELTTLRSSETQLVALQTEALGNLTRLGGLNELGSAEASRLIADIGIGAAPGMGEAAAAGIAGATKGGGYQPNQAAVGNMKAFLATPGFGSDLGETSQKTNYRIDGQSVYKATESVGDGVKAGDYFYLDGLHKDHLEVFDSKGNFKSVINLDGTVNSIKTDAASGRKINVK